MNKMTGGLIMPQSPWAKQHFSLTLQATGLQPLAQSFFLAHVVDDSAVLSGEMRVESIDV